MESRAAALILLLLPVVSFADGDKPAALREKVCLRGDLYIPGVDPVSTAMKYNASKPIQDALAAAGYKAEIAAVAAGDYGELCYTVDYQPKTEGEEGFHFRSFQGSTEDKTVGGKFQACVTQSREWIARLAKGDNLVAASVQRSVDDSGQIARCQLRVYLVESARRPLPSSIQAPKQ